MVCFLIQGIAVFALAHYQHTVILYLGTLAFGLTMGNIIMMQSLITGECFGLVSFATVSGLAGVFTMSGAAVWAQHRRFHLRCDRQLPDGIYYFCRHERGCHPGDLLCEATQAPNNVIAPWQKIASFGF